MAGCGDGSRPANTSGLTGRPAVLRAPPGDRASAGLRGTLILDLDESLASPWLLRVDQGYREDGHGYFGREVRYRLPDLRAGPDGIALGVTARLHGPEEEWPLRVRPLPLDRGWFGVELPAGDHRGSRIEIALGDGDAAPGTPTVPLEIELHAFQDTAEGSRPLPGCVPVRIVDPSSDWLRILGPAQANPGEPLRYRVLFMNGWSGPRSTSMVTLPVAETVEVRFDGEWQERSLTLEDDPSRPQGGTLEVPAPGPGVHRLEVRCPERPGLRGLANPCLVRESGNAAPGWFFGSIHNHTAAGGHASGTPRRALEYARDVSRLDFVALTEHSEFAQFDWPLQVALAEEYSRKGEFVCFAGLEWTHPSAGHRHAIFLDAALARPFSAVPNPAAPDVRCLDSVEALAAGPGRDENTLLVVHHSLWAAGGVRRPYDFGAPGDLPRQRLAEVYSWHGCSLGGPTLFPIHDNPGQQLVPESASSILGALGRGHGFALEADGDNHLGRPGSLVGVVWPSSLRYAFNGLVVARAETRTRQAIFHALDAGRVYGTTGTRSLLTLRRVAPDRLRLDLAAASPIASLSWVTPSGTVVEERFPPVPPDAGVPGAALYLTLSRGVWDLAGRELPAGQDVAGPSVLVVALQDGHRIWSRVPAAAHSR
jgi:hypothetical protein